jgi:hypothetical protein
MYGPALSHPRRLKAFTTKDTKVQTLKAKPVSHFVHLASFVFSSLL